MVDLNVAILATSGQSLGAYAYILQKARPIADISTGTWTPSSGSDLYAMLDEETPSDLDFIRSSDDPIDDTCEVKLDALVDPNMSFDHTLFYRISQTGSFGITLLLSLMEGSTERDNWSVSVPTGTTTYERALSPSVIDSISDYTDLRVRMTATLVELDEPYHVVSTTGNDSNDGTLAEPWATFAYAVTQMVAGETLYIRGGTYNERLFLDNDGGGSAGSYVTYRNYPGETVTINGLGVALTYENGLVQSGTEDYVKFIGLRVVDSQRAGICCKSSNYIYIEDCYTYDTGRSGIGLWSCTNVTLDGNEIERPCVIDAAKNKDGVDECISVAGLSSYVEIMNCTVHDTPTGYNPARAGGEGVNVKDGGHHVYIHDNHVYNINNKFGFACDGWDNGVHDLYYYNNEVHDCKWGFLPETEKAGTSQYVYIYNNIIYDMHEEDDTPGIGVYIPDFGTSDGWNRDYEVYNNTIYGCGGGILVNNDLVDNILIANNILNSNSSYDIEVLAAAEAETTIDYNLFDESGDHHGTNSVIGDADFVTPGSDFHLQATSDAIGNGSATYAPADDYDGISRGTPPDIGAFEYVP